MSELRFQCGLHWIAAESFVRQVIEFMKTRGIESIGRSRCGDFRWQRITSRCDVQYVGVDIVQAMVARTRSSFATTALVFCVRMWPSTRCPDADLCLIRQVLQHLSNARSTPYWMISHYKYALISEHVPIAKKVLIVTSRMDPTYVPTLAQIYLERKPFSRASRCLGG